MVNKADEKVWMDAFSCVFATFVAFDIYVCDISIGENNIVEFL